MKQCETSSPRLHAASDERRLGAFHHSGEESLARARWFAAIAAFAVAGRVEGLPSSSTAVASIASLVRRAQDRSETALRARAELQAAQARRDVAGRVLPANRVLEGGIGHRKTEPGAVDLDRGTELSSADRDRRAVRRANRCRRCGVRGARVVAEAAERVVATPSDVL